jgi:CRP-like cAMP-binding protein
MRRTLIRPRDVLVEPWRRIRNVWFPVTGVVSLTTPLRDGRHIETAMIGNEGMVGVQGFLAGRPMDSGQAIAQIAGEALVIDADAFGAEVHRDPRLRGLMLAYTQALLAEISQAVACNGVHEIEQRAAKWLLRSHDRVDGDTIHLTQEFLAEMLGVTRPSVTVAARTLQAAGLIRYSRGQVTVLDRDGLEEAACECYQAVKDVYRRLLPLPPPR